MSQWILYATLVILTLFGYWLGSKKSASSITSLHSNPVYHGVFVSVWIALPTIILLIIWAIFEPIIIMEMSLSVVLDHVKTLTNDQLSLFKSNISNIINDNIASSHNIKAAQKAAQKAANEYIRLSSMSNLYISLLTIYLAIGGFVFAYSTITPLFKARNKVEKLISRFLILCAVIAVLTTIGIVLSLLFESIKFFLDVPPLDFLLGLKWSPQTALRADQVGSSSAFGAIPLFAGTLLITLVAMVVAVPIGLFTAIYLSEYAHSKVRAIIKPLLEILAGIPTVVYGFFAAITVAPFFREVGESLGMNVASESALAAGSVMGIMIIPFISSLSDDVINAVPKSLREGSLGLGATQSETLRQIILPAALPGIFAAVLLAISRAIGETMIVVMAAGYGSNLTANPFEAVTTVTVQIVALLTGDQEFDSPKTLSAFALGLTLFTVTFSMNYVALRIVRKYREKYD